MKKVSITFLILSVVFCVCLVCSNLFATRVWSIGIFGFEMSSAVLIFPISYIINDTLTEVYGYKQARLVIWLGFAMCLAVTLFTFLATSLPKPLQADSRELADKFDSLFALIPSVMLASLLAFISGSLFNSLIMSKMKIRSKGRQFAKRAIVSTIGGEIMDSLVFMPIAYAGVLPFTEILNIMASETSLKILIEILFLPLTTLIVKKIKEKEQLDTFDNGISYNPFAIKDI